jgi:hypothetical protein
MLLLAALFTPVATHASADDGWYVTYQWGCEFGRTSRGSETIERVEAADEGGAIDQARSYQRRVCARQGGRLTSFRVVRVQRAVD